MRMIVRKGSEERYQAVDTARNIAMADIRRSRVLPGNKSRRSKEVDQALPGTYTKVLYDQL